MRCHAADLGRSGIYARWEKRGGIYGFHQNESDSGHRKLCGGLEIITVEPDGGSSNPTSLTFDFAPKLLIIGWQETLDNGFFTSNLGDRVTSDNYYSIYTGALTTQFKQYRGFGDPSGSYAKRSSDGKTITWYATGHANAQRNDRRYKYYYLAIG